MPWRAHLPKVCWSHICNNLFSSADPPFWPAAKALKKSKAVPAEIIGGRRRVKPSTKAKRAAGIYTADEAESDSDPENVNTNAGLKRKAGKGKDKPSTGKMKPKETPKEKPVYKKACVDNDDEESMKEHEGDQADAYEKLWLERETDRPVSLNNICISLNANKDAGEKRSQFTW